MSSPEIHTQLSKHLNKYCRFDSNEVDDLLEHLHLKRLSKNEFLLKEGEVCRHRTFILKGLFRSFYIDQNAKENIILFAIENWWLTDLDSLINASP